MKRIEGVHFQRQDHPNLNTTASLIVPLLVSLTHSRIAMDWLRESALSTLRVLGFVQQQKLAPENT